MEKPLVLIDLDETFLPTYHAYLNYIQKPELFDQTTRYELDDLFGTGFTEDFKLFIQKHHELIQPTPHLLKIFEKFSRFFQIKFVSNRSQPEIDAFRRYWPQFKVESKSEINSNAVHAKVYIDDWPDERIKVDTVIIIDCPWNQSIGKVIRVSSLEDALKLIVKCHLRRGEA